MLRICLLLIISIFTFAAQSVELDYSSLGVTAYEQGNYQKAKEYFDLDLKLQQNKYPSDHPRIAVCFHNLGMIYAANHQYPLAVEYYKKAIAIESIQFGGSHWRLGINYSNLGNVYRLMNHNKLAEEWLLKAITVYNSEANKHAYNNLGLVYAKQGRQDLAIMVYRKSLALELKNLGQLKSDTAPTFHNLSMSYRAKKDFVKALHYAKKADRLVKKDNNYSGHFRRIIQANLQNLQHKKIE